ncbi:MAG TPA: RNA polymerase sigma factor [Polyangiales bacterium]|jgi:RNA polymerase sigma-70 factor (ECF subfamily)|nr:RNA polymerase sigma factor [Polyangiales bacterium]
MVHDEQEMSRYLAGDAAAFAELFRRYQPELLRFFRHRRFQGADCDDLVQQTFLQLHRARGDFRAGERLRPWLYTIARNVACDHGRRLARRAEQAGDFERYEGPVPLAQTRIEVRGAGALDGALRQLSLRDRRLIDEHFAQERTFHELAQRDGVQEAALRVRAHRARARLRAMLDERAA